MKKRFATVNFVVLLPAFSLKGKQEYSAKIFFLPKFDKYVPFGPDQNENAFCDTKITKSGFDSLRWMTNISGDI